MSFALILGHSIILIGYLGLILFILLYLTEGIVQLVLDRRFHKGWLRIALPEIIGLFLIFWLWSWISNGTVYIDWIKGLL